MIVTFVEVWARCAPGLGDQTRHGLLLCRTPFRATPPPIFCGVVSLTTLSKACKVYYNVVIENKRARVAAGT